MEPGPHGTLSGPSPIGEDDEETRDRGATPRQGGQTVSSFGRAQGGEGGQQSQRHMQTQVG